MRYYFRYAKSKTFFYYNGGVVRVVMKLAITNPHQSRRDNLMVVMFEGAKIQQKSRIVGVFLKR